MNKVYALVVGLIMATSLMGMVIIGGRDLPTAVKAIIDDDKPTPDRKIEDLDPEDRICFYNWLNEEAKKYNFGPSGYDSLSDYKKAEGELLDRLTDDGDKDEKLPDPALMAAVAYAIDRTHGTDILAKEYKETKVPGEQVNLASKHLMDSESYRKEVLGKIKKELEEADVKVEEIGAYTSMMWMVPDGYEDRPAITIADSNHDGGHCLVIKWENGDVLRLRIECGYQPMDVHWPDNPPDDDTTPPPTSTSPPPTTESTPETTTVTTTTLVPKNTKEAVKVDSDPNNGRGTGTAKADTGLRPEPTWLTTQAPTTQAPTAQVTTQAQTPKQTVTQTVTHDGKDYVVDEQPAESWTPQKEVASDTPSDAAGSGIIVNEPPPSSGGGGFADRY